MIYVVTISEASEVLRLISARLSHLRSRKVVGSKHMEIGELSNVLQMMKNKELDIVVATTAFGCGIDIPFIRTAIHYKLSYSIVDYCQQLGRIGRDSVVSLSLVITYPNAVYSFAARDKTSVKSAWKIFMDDSMCRRVALAKFMDGSNLIHISCRDDDETPLGAMCDVCDSFTGTVQLLCNTYIIY